MYKSLGLLFFVFSISLHAQEKLLSMDDAVLGQRNALAPKNLNQLQWIPGAGSYSYVTDKDDEEVLFRGNMTNEKALVSLSEINETLEEMSRTAFMSFPFVEWTDTNSFEFSRNNNIFTFSVDHKKLTIRDSLELPDNAKNIDKAPKTGAVAFTQNNNLYILHNDVIIPVSVHENEGIVSGQVVSRVEFGINTGTYWSPDGQKLSYYVKDETSVSDYPIINWTTKPATAETIKYPMAGSAGTEKIQVMVYDLKSEESISLQTGEPETQYLTNIAWSPDSRKIYIAHLNRDQDHMQLKRYDAENGSLEKTLFEEKSDKYVEPLQPVKFVNSHPDQFIWESKRTGYNHLFLYNTQGKLLRQLTKGDWMVTEFQGFDERGEKAFFSSTAISPINRDLYSVQLQNGKTERLTHAEGTHNTMVSDNGKYFLDKYESTEVPGIITINSVDGQTSRQLLQAENPLKEYALGEMKIFTIEDNDGGDLYCRMYLPTDFDSTKKYPVVVYLYGGPHAQMIRNDWGGGGRLWFQYMAQRGYIVWTLDNRGSAGRGMAWEQQTFRNLGSLEMKDQLTGIAFLKSKAYVDSDRIGIHGWSFGGFMTVSLMSRHPGIFKTGVAGGPVIDWSYYEVMYTERYMDTPEQNPEGYDRSNLMNYIDDLEGNLLLIHGTSDDVVLWQHTQMYLKKAVEIGKQLNYFVYPMHKHNVRGEDRVHLMQKVTDYFEDFL